jgi:flagellar hook protein FlgE
MERSLLAAVSGIEANQTYLDVIGNDVANTDTVAYKSQSTFFTDLLAEQVAAGSAPPGTTVGAGVNPIAVGSGVRVGAVSTDLSEGSLEQTGQPTDVAIQGSGYFVVVQGGQTLYTRDGHFTLDANGDLATTTGGLVQGWQATAGGTIDTAAPPTAISIPTGLDMKARETSTFTLGGNLPVWNGSGTPPVATFTYDGYDALGDTVPVTFTFTGVKGQANEWTMQASVPNAQGQATNLFSTPPTVAFDPTTGEISVANSSGGSGTLVKNPDGSVTFLVDQTGTGSTATMTNMPSNYSFQPGDVWGFTFPAPGTSGEVTQFNTQQTITVTSQDGSAAGLLVNFSIGQDGVVTGTFSNGLSQPIAQIALATFANPQGLDSVGGLMYLPSANSGPALVGTAMTGGRGSLVGGSLEMSNVNLAKELTDLVVAQEAYQANTKVIATSATVLQSLVNMP